MVAYLIDQIPSIGVFNGSVVAVTKLKAFSEIKVCQ